MADDGDGDVLRGGGGVYVPRVILFTGSLVGTAVMADLARHGSLITQYFHHFTFIGLALVTIVVIGEKPGLSSYLTHILCILKSRRGLAPFFKRSLYSLHIKHGLSIRRET